MGIIDILLTAVGLSMDASAVGMTNGMNEPKMPLRKIFLVAGFYGVFQGLMPLIGYLCASLFAQFVASVAPYVALVLLERRQLGPVYFAILLPPITVFYAWGDGIRCEGWEKRLG